MPDTCRLLDSGLHGAAHNIALDRALLAAHRAGQAPDTLHFFRFTPCAVVGYHQSVAQEVHTDYCRAHGIEIQRRLSGGGAVYIDEGQLVWELYLRRARLPGADMRAVAATVCGAVAEALRGLGVDARFRPRNDIEVDGRKLSGTGGVFEGDTILYQGTLLLRFDAERMLRVLRIPAEKHARRGLGSPRERVTSLAELLGEPPPLATVQAALAAAFADTLGVRFAPGRLSAVERAEHARALREIDSPEWVRAVDRSAGEAPQQEVIHRCPAGLIRVGVALDLPRRRLRQAWLSGDFFVRPRRVVADLEAALRNVAMDEVPAIVQAVLGRDGVDLMGLRPADFSVALQRAMAVGNDATELKY